MIDDQKPLESLYQLAQAQCEGALTVAQVRQLEALVSSSASLRHRYVLYMQAHAAAEQHFRSAEKKRTPSSSVLPVPGSGRTGTSVPRSPVLGFLDRMMHVSGDTPVATALMWMVMFLCTGMLLTMIIGIIVMVHGVNVHVDAPQVAQQPSVAPSTPHPLAPSVPASPVARLIHTAECQWAAGGDAPVEGDDLIAGRKLVLKSGLAEIMFQSGARAVLQGPATLEVASKTGAFLHQGKISVTVEEPEARGFEIHTPGMKVTDLGTEFGVLVAKDGIQEVHVFRGKVQAETARTTQNSELSTKNSALSAPAPLILSAHEAIRIVAPDNPIVPIEFDAKQFVRAMPKPEPFLIFGTGVGLDRGANDPHWEMIADSTNPRFKPQAAVVCETQGGYLRDSRELGQWIATERVPPSAAGGCRWTFRTRFNLDGFDPSTARIDARIAADAYLVELRLNGKPLSLPADASLRARDLCATPLTAQIDSGFVAGMNTLEVVIENNMPKGPGRNPMALCAECKGSARRMLKIEQ